MQFFTCLLLAAAAAQAHYTFPRLVVNGKAEDKDWSVTRMTKNAQSKQGIENPTVADIRCYSSRTAPEVAVIPVGAVYYLAKVPAGSSVSTWDGAGAVWFKFHTEMPLEKNSQLVWPGQNEYKTTNATIPLAVPSGDYLLRVEHIGLHVAMTENKAQFYLSCSQVRITGGGDGTPGPLVEFPGAYQSRDPGILVNLNKITPETYIPPGPPVWTG